MNVLFMFKDGGLTIVYSILIRLKPMSCFFFFIFFFPDVKSYHLIFPLIQSFLNKDQPVEFPCQIVKAVRNMYDMDEMK